MPDQYIVRYIKLFSDQLEEISDYIVADSPQNARSVIRRILSAVDSLELFPARYPVVDELSKRVGEELRSMPVLPYFFRYHIDEHHRVVTILGIRHGSRHD